MLKKYWLYKLLINSKNLFLVFIVLALVGCDSPKLSSLQDGDIIVAFGDSLTKGVGTSGKHSYPSVLTGLTGLDVINAGVSGETTAEGLIRLPSVIDEYSPSLILLLEGGNDILQNKDHAAIERNLDRMIEIALESKIQVVLIGVPEKRLFSSSAPLYHNLAEKHKLVFESELIGSLMRSPSKKSDSVHFNKEGYAVMAESIYNLLSDNGAFE